MACPRVIEQAGRATLLIAAKPFANGGHGGGEQLRRAFDPALFGALDEPQAMVVRVFHFTHQIEITSGGGHGDRILRGARGPAPPPSAGPRAPTPNTNPVPSDASHSYTSTSPGGYDVRRLSHPKVAVDETAEPAVSCCDA